MCNVHVQCEMSGDSYGFYSPTESIPYVPFLFLGQKHTTPTRVVHAPSCLLAIVRDTIGN